MSLLEIITALILIVSLIYRIFGSYAKGRNLFFPQPLRLTYWLTVIFLFPAALLIDTPYARDIPLPLRNGVIFFLYAITSFLALWLIDLILVDYYLVRRKKVYIAVPLRKLIFFITFFLLILLILQAVYRFNPLAMIAIPTVLTAGIAFALQDTFKRFVAGISLSRVVRIGNWVAFNNWEGKVVDFNWMRTTVRLWDGSDLIVPNNLLQTQEFRRVINTFRIELDLRAPYDIPPEKVKHIVLSTVSTTTPGELVLSDPAPTVYLFKFTDFYINYRFWFWVNDYNQIWTVTSNVAGRVWYAFKRAGIEIPLPQQIVRLSSPSPEESEFSYILNLRLMENIELFRPFTVERKQEIANLFKKKIYAPDEIVIDQGSPGSSFFIVVSGKLEVMVRAENKETKRVGYLSAGEYFGEMSLLTGEPRTATVRTVTETELLELDKEPFQQILMAHPQLVEQISEVLAQRQVVLDRVKEETIIPQTKEIQTRFAQHIRRFFGL